jgi:hypothetical protein
MTTKMTTQTATELTAPSEKDGRRADRVLGGSMVWVAIRCTLQYVVLPFVLPWFGVTGAFSAGLSLAIEAVALVMIAYNVRRLWSTSWRWRYLALSAGMLAVMGLFAYLDVKVLLGLA